AIRGYEEEWSRAKALGTDLNGDALVAVMTDTTKGTRALVRLRQADPAVVAHWQDDSYLFLPYFMTPDHRIWNCESGMELVNEKWTRNSVAAWDLSHAYEARAIGYLGPPYLILADQRQDKALFQLVGDSKGRFSLKKCFEDSSSPVQDAA